MDATADPAALWRASRSRASFVDVPELGFAVVDGAGAPDGEQFQAAVHGLFTVSYAVHFTLKKQGRSASRVMPLEALWSFDPSSPPGVLAPVVASTPAASDRRRWRWQAMIAQPEPVTAEDVAAAVAGQRAAHPEVAAVRYLRWREGLAAQILHVGPYAAEAPSFVRLHGDLRAAGYRPRGRHHEIYLGDPRRSAAERLRTVLRQPVELAGDA